MNDISKWQKKLRTLKNFGEAIRIMVSNSDDYTDEEIYEFLLERYGDFILLKPPLKLNTLILWFFPLILFMCAIFILYLFNKKSKK